MIKNIVIISLGFLGDTILVEPLTRNIKNNFPNSNIIFVVDNRFKEIPQGFECVDKVIYFDKYNEHNGLKGYLTLAKQFKNKKIDTAIITHSHERSIILAKFIKAKNIISLPLKGNLNIFNLLINKKRKYIEDEIRTTYKADYTNKYLPENYKIENYDVTFKIKEDIEKNVIEKFNYFINDEYIVLSPASKDIWKDWSFDNIENFIKNSPLKIVLVGVDKTNEIAQHLKEKNIDFIDVTNQTSIMELAVIMKHAKSTVSVDTGTMHLSYAVKTPTICLFFNKEMVAEWAPKDRIKNKILIGSQKFEKEGLIIEKNINYSEVLETLKGLLNDFK